MTYRAKKERLFQSAGYELGGLLVAAPVCAALTGSSFHTSLLLVVTLTLATMLWAPLFNTLFDRAEGRLTGRVASNRPARLRLVHAFALEASDTLISVPLLMAFGGLTLTQALIADLSLLLVYMAYTYAYHQLYDWVRPVAQPA